MIRIEATHNLGPLAFHKLLVIFRLDFEGCILSVRCVAHHDNHWWRWWEMRDLRGADSGTLEDWLQYEVVALLLSEKSFR
jgi:hypothetical protein